jgi:hypothetical protein
LREMEREWKHRETRGFLRERERENATVVRHEIVSRPTRECKRRVRRGCYQRYERVQASRETRFVVRRLGRDSFGARGR